MGQEFEFLLLYSVFFEFFKKSFFNLLQNVVGCLRGGVVGAGVRASGGAPTRAAFQHLRMLATLSFSCKC
jgi:hypothetical protein